MNKIETFSPTQITSVEAHLAWASLEVLADDVNELQVMAAGNDKDVSDLRIQEKEGRLVVEQPTYGLSIKLNSERWMQIVIRLPRSWKGALDMSTITAPLRARGISGTDVTLDSVSGDMRAANINAIALTLRQVSGGIQAQDLNCDHVSVRTVSGKVRLSEVACLTAKLSGVSGDQRMECTRVFERVDANTVSGDVELYAPLTQADIALRAVTGRVLTGGVSIVENAPQVRGTSVSGNLAIHCNLE